MKWKTHDIDFAILLLREGVKTRNVARLLGTDSNRIYKLLNLRGLGIKDLKNLSPQSLDERKKIIEKFCENGQNLKKLRSFLDSYSIDFEDFLVRSSQFFFKPTEGTKPIKSTRRYPDLILLLLREGIKVRDVARLLDTKSDAIHYFLRLRDLNVKDLRKMRPLPQEERSRIIQEFCAIETNLEKLRSMLELYGMRFEGFITHPFKRHSGKTEVLNTYEEFVFLLIRDGIGIRNVAKVFSVRIANVRNFLSSRGIRLTELRELSPLPDEERSKIIKGFCAKKSNWKKLCLVLDSYNIRYEDFLERSFREYCDQGFNDTSSAFIGRNEEIAELRRQGNTLEVIAQQYGITRERVRQIILRYNKISDNPVDVEEATRLARQPTPEQLEQRTRIVELCRSGFTYRQIAFALEVSENDVAECIREHNKSVEYALKVPAEDNRNTVSEETKNEIIQERRKGKTISEIVEQFGISYQTVHRVLKDVGMSRPSRAVRSKRILELCRQGISHDASFCKFYVRSVLTHKSASVSLLL